MSNSPSTTKKQYDNMLDDWLFIDDLTGGQKTIVSKKGTYLPQGAKETPKSFNARLKQAGYFDMFNPTVDGIAGIALATKPKYGDDVPDEIIDNLENADGAGTHIDIQTIKFFKGGIRKGVYHLLVDMPVENEEVRGKSDEDRLGIRPINILIDPKDIINWKTGVINGKTVLTLVVIKEIVTESDGLFGETEIEQFRVLRRGSWQIWREQNKVFSVYEEGDTSLDYIPLVTLDLDDDTGMMEARPPLYDLGKLNINHYHRYTDANWSAYLANNPLFGATGVQKEDFKDVDTSGNRALTASDPQAKMFWIEYQGNGIESNRNLMKDAERQISIMGLSVLAEKTTDVTATEKKIDTAQVQSKVQNWIRKLKDALENMLQIHADFMSIESGGSVEVNYDILSEAMTPETMKAYSEMVLKGQLSVETMWSLLLTGRRLNDDFDEDIERDRVENEAVPPLPPKVNNE